MDVQKSDVSSNQDAAYEFGDLNTVHSNLTVIGNNEKLLSAHKCYTEMQSTVEPSGGSELDDSNEPSTSTYDPTTNTQVITSDNCLKSGMLSCESIPDKSVLTSNTENPIVTTLCYKITNLHLSSDEPFNINSKKVGLMNNVKKNDESVVIEESSVHEFLDVIESSSTVHSFCDTDSLKTCINGDSNLLNDSDLAKNELKKCSTKDDTGKNHSESKHSSEIKERVMSYLNKHSASSESSDEEQMCNKVLVKEDKLENKSDLCIENCNSEDQSEEVKSTSSNIVPWEPISPVQNSQAVECSSIVVTDTACTLGSGKTSFVLDSDVLKPTTSTSDSCQHEIVIDSNSSTQAYNENISIKMDINDSVYLTNDTISDSFSNSPLNETTSCESEMPLSPQSNSSCKSLACIGATANSYFPEGKVDSSCEGGNTLQFCKQKAVASSDSSNCSLFDQSSLSFHDKSGMVTTSPPLSSWGKLSFQSFTTPSIKFPILSSMSGIEEKPANAASRSTGTSFNNEIDEPSAQNKSKDDLNSRKTKSTEELFSNMLFSTSTETFFSDNVSGKSSSKISNLHFVSPIVHTESSWSENSLQKNIKFGTEKSFGDSFSTTDSKIISSSSLGSVASGPFNSGMENPFSKKTSESIGIFNSHQETGFSGFSAVFKPVATIFSPKREKFTEESVNFSEDATKSSPGTKKKTTEIGVTLNSQNQQLLSSVPPKFFFKCTEQSSDSRNLTFSSGSQSTIGISDVLVRSPKETEHMHISKAETAVSLSSINPSSFQFRVNGEKSKTPNLHRFACPRFSRKPTKSYKQNDKGFSKFVREAAVFNSSTNSLPKTPFKPLHGSDVIMDKNGRSKNVVVRYQNIACMREHQNTSPEELRLQYYDKTRVTGPFRFSASAESNECHNYRKIQNKEVQTEESIVSKKYELSEIWRALECPVCLDVVMPPVYQCEQGHHACLTCWNKVVTCPLCKRHKSVTRNYMAEALIDQIPLPCKYHIEGCKETVSKANKVSHEETCSYRMYQCPVPSCNQAHSYQNMCTHFKKVHKSLLHHEGHSVGKGEKFCDVLYKEFMSSSLIHAFDIAKWGLFFLREVVTKHSKALFVQVMPASPEPAAYFYHLEVCDHHDCRKECYKGRVFSMGKSVQEILHEEEYLSLSVLILKTVKKSAPLKIVVTIWQLKPAFTLSTE